MKLFFLLTCLATVALSSSDCGNKNSTTTYKGRLEIKGICSNYTIKLTEGTIDTTMIAGNWTDETTQKTYTNVFALKSPCSFPSTINQGDEFYFAIDTAQQKDCIVCMAYYPTPPKGLTIKVVDK